MYYQVLAHLTLAVHLLFVIFVVLGALLAFKWQWIIWVHIPCAIWGILLELKRWTCPLTYLENYFRKMAQSTGYEGGFIEHYLLAIIYPEGLTTEIQIYLGIITLLVNLCIYALLVRSRFPARTRSQ